MVRAVRILLLTVVLLVPSAVAGAASATKPLRSGGKVLIADGINPVVSPDGTKLAYVRVESQNDISYRTALVIRDLQTTDERAIPLTPVNALGDAARQRDQLVARRELGGAVRR